MRILLLTQWFQPEPFFKGLPFAKALRDQGHEVEVLTGFPNYPGGKVYPGYRVRARQVEEMDGIRVNRVALYPSHDQSGMRRMLNYLSFACSANTTGGFLFRKPDIVYVYNLPTLAMVARSFRLLKGCPFVVDIQDLWPESVSSSGMMRSPLAMRLLMGMCDSAYRSADHITVLSPGFKRVLVQRGIPADKISIIYNWCDESGVETESSNDALRQELGFAGRFNVVFAGTMGTVQALDSVLDAAKIVAPSAPRVRFTFIGGGTAVDGLRARAESMGLTNVAFLPRRPMSEIGAVLALADVLLVHLKDDPLFEVTVPSKVQAYMRAGKPLLVGVKGDAAQLVQAAGAGLACEPENPRSMAETVLLMSRMSAGELRSMGDSGRDFYNRTLSMEVGCRAFSTIFSKVVREGKRRDEEKL